MEDHSSPLVHLSFACAFRKRGTELTCFTSTKVHIMTGGSLITTRPFVLRMPVPQKRYSCTSKASKLRTFVLVKQEDHSLPLDHLYCPAPSYTMLNVCECTLDAFSGTKVIKWNNALLDYYKSTITGIALLLQTYKY